jgi:hypothetical protein
MGEEMEEVQAEQGTSWADGEQRMWTAVIVQALQEWQAGPLRASREAEAFLFQDQEDFEMVCHGAGLDPTHLRAKMAKLPKRRDPWSISFPPTTPRVA